MSTANSSRRPGPRGAEYLLEAGPYRALITEVGATLASLTYDGRPLVHEGPRNQPMMHHRGAIIAPWPNRVGDGRYTVEGTTYQLPLTEPARSNALHGLVSFQSYELLALEPLPSADGVASAQLRTMLYATPSYPFTLAITVTYELHPLSGLRTTVHAENLSQRGTPAAPYGCCPHPYLVAGEDKLEEWTLQFGAHRVLEVREDRLLPTGMLSVDPGTRFDFKDGKVIGDMFLDHALTDLVRDGDGIARVRLTSRLGTGVEIAFDRKLPWVQIHTADRPEPEWNRKGLAVEPMTCPPDAFNSGTDLVRLSPGQSHEVSWTIKAL
ncbi:aldose 1-epimerase family protein [Devriesea agamarum]|uniref:aldose 1-epimerase family protein n=1 Tax=Devriesea agamarum TaxID=472569 RepID=UPI00071CE132|nr:aldose 1-epimerase family protein [Devriesea agamarum]